MTIAKHLGLVLVVLAAGLILTAHVGAADMTEKEAREHVAGDRISLYGVDTIRVSIGIFVAGDGAEWLKSKFTQEWKDSVRAEVCDQIEKSGAGLAIADRTARSLLRSFPLLEISISLSSSAGTTSFINRCDLFHDVTYSNGLDGWGTVWSSRGRAAGWDQSVTAIKSNFKERADQFVYQFLLDWSVANGEKFKEALRVLGN